MARRVGGCVGHHIQRRDRQGACTQPSSSQLFYKALGGDLVRSGGTATSRPSLASPRVPQAPLPPIW